MKRYGVYWPDLNACYRATFVIDKAGTVRFVERYGRRIYLLTDEPCNRIVFGGNEFVSPVRFYPCTLIAYSFGKVLLAPGEAFVVPQGVWHRVVVHEPSRFVHITPGPASDHRPL